MKANQASIIIQCRGEGNSLKTENSDTENINHCNILEKLKMCA